MRFVLLLLFLTSTMMESRGAMAPLYQLDFTDGGVLNTGTVGGAASDQPSRDKTGKVSIQRDASSKWSVYFLMAANGSEGPSLDLPDSEDKLTLDSMDDSMTIALWIKWLGPDAHDNPMQVLVTKEADKPERGWTLGISDEGLISFRWISSTDSSFRMSAAEIATNDWHHIVVVWMNASKERVQFYIDGRRTGPKYNYTGSGPLVRSEVPIRIGASSAGYRPANADMTGIRIYSTALDDEEIAEICNAGRP